MKNNLIIIGANGHGRVAADIALKMNKWSSIAFLDDDETIQSSMGLEVVGRSGDTLKYIKNCDFFVGIGSNTTRGKIQKRLENEGASVPVLIHPNAIIGEQVELAAGTIVMAGVVINCCTKVGKGCIVNTSSTLDHDNWIDDFVHISPGVHLAGKVKIGRETWLGIGSIVNNNVTITESCKIGAGAVVLKDILKPGTYVGVPARSI